MGTVIMATSLLMISRLQHPLYHAQFCPRTRNHLDATSNSITVIGASDFPSAHTDGKDRAAFKPYRLRLERKLTIPSAKVIRHFLIEPAKHAWIIWRDSGGEKSTKTCQE